MGLIDSAVQRLTERAIRADSPTDTSSADAVRDATAHAAVTDSPAGPVAVAVGDAAGPAKPLHGQTSLAEPPAPAAATPDRPPVQLNLGKLAAAGFITPSSHRSQIADEFRVLKRPLLDNAHGKGAAPISNGKRIVVTSALPGEGKSFVAVNLAMSIAMEFDQTVLLVDADVIRPSLPSLLGVPLQQGLLDLLDDPDRDLDSVLLQTNIPQLTLLLSGHQRPRATELLASESMLRLLAQLSSRYPDCIVIFDSPPLLVTTESRVLASHMGQVVYVVCAERTLRADVNHALSTIESCPVKMLVLNQATRIMPRSYGDAGYGSYGYGYGAGE